MDKDIAISKEEQPLMVTIRCITYNHEPYIRQCLEGFVMQKTNFRFEAIVHDDASTDGTAAIIREYAEKYPDIIKPIYETENQYSKHDGSLRRIMDAHMHGKYIALCEGDDYWIDPLKLQKQVDFLEGNPEYSMCFHNAIEKWENKLSEEHCFSRIQNREYLGVEIFYKWIVPTASVVLKSEIFKSNIYDEVFSNPDILFGDTPLFLCATHFGRLYGMEDVMSVYRRHEGGMVYGFCKERDLLLNKSDIAIYKVFGNAYKKAAKKRICKRNINIYMQLSTNERKQHRFLLREAFRMNRILYIVYLAYRTLRGK